MKLISLLLVVLLAGCGAAPLIKEPIEVKIPVAILCLSEPVAKPSWILDNPDLATQNVFEKALALIQELEQRREYERQLEAVLLACTTKQQ